MSGDGKSIRFHPDLYKQLENLAALGIYGGTPSEIVRRFVREGIERIAQEGTIEKILRDRKLLALEKRETIKTLNTKSGAA